MTVSVRLILIMALLILASLNIDAIFSSVFASTKLNAIANKCYIAGSGPACLKYCAMAKKLNVPTAASFNCQSNNLRSSEAKMFDRKACNTNNCIFKLYQIGPNRYSGSGFNLIISNVKQFPEGGWGFRGVLTSTSGNAVISKFCGAHCGSDWEKTSGSLKIKDVTEVEGGYMISIGRK